MPLLTFALGMIRTYGGVFFSFRRMKLTMSGFLILADGVIF